MNDYSGAFAYALLLPIIGGILGILLSYLVIRAAVGAGLRDHLKWIEKHRPSHAAHLRGEHPPQP